MNVFEVEAMLSICLYQRFLTFVISFDCDTLVTKSLFCPNFWQCMTNCSDMQIGRSQNNVACISNVDVVSDISSQILIVRDAKFHVFSKSCWKGIPNSCNDLINV